MAHDRDWQVGPPDLDEIGLPAFAYVRRGYDPDQVVAHVAGLVDQIEALRAYAAGIEDRHASLEAARADAERRADLLARRLDGDLTELAARETEKLLVAARALAEETRARASSDAAALVAATKKKAKAMWIETQRRCQERLAATEDEVAARRADADALVAEVERLRDDAARYRSAADEEAVRAAAEADAAAIIDEARLVADGILDSARAEAGELVAEAAREAEGIVDEARAARDRLLGDLSRRRGLLRSQVEQLQAGRDRLVVAYETVRRTWEEAVNELDLALPAARAEAQAAVERLLAQGADEEAVARELAGLRQQEDDTADGPVIVGDRDEAEEPDERSGTGLFEPAEETARDVDRRDPEPPPSSPGEQLAGRRLSSAVRVIPPPAAGRSPERVPPASTRPAAPTRLGPDVTVDDAFEESVVVIRPADRAEPAPENERANDSEDDPPVTATGEAGREDADEEAPDVPADPPVSETPTGEDELAGGTEPVEPADPDETTWRSPFLPHPLEARPEEPARADDDAAERRHAWWMAPSHTPSGSSGPLSTIELVAALVQGLSEPDEQVTAAVPSDPVQAARARCDAAVSDAKRSLRRRLKATLADDENQLLDVLQRTEVGVPSAPDVLVDEMAHRRRFVEAARAGLLLAATTGRELAADLALDEARRRYPGSLPDGFAVDIGPAPAIADDLAEWLGDELLDLLRTRLLRCFPDQAMVSENPRLDRARRDEVQWAVRAAYRRIKGAKVDALIDRASIEAVYRAVRDHLPDGLHPAGLEPLELFRSL